MGTSSAARGPLRTTSISEPVVLDKASRNVGAEEAASSKEAEKMATPAPTPDKLPRAYVADAESEDDIARPVKKTEKLGIKDDKTKKGGEPKKQPKKRPAKAVDPEKASSNGDDDGDDEGDADAESGDAEAPRKATAAKSKPKSKAKAKAKAKGKAKTKAKAKAKGKSKQDNSSKNSFADCGVVQCVRKACLWL